MLPHVKPPSEILTHRVITPDWIVEDLFPRGTFIIIAGEAGAGKSYLMYNLAYAIASNRLFLGHQTYPTRVLYVDEENADPDFLQYNQWAWVANGSTPLEALDPWLRFAHFDFLSDWQGKLTKAVREFKPGLVIIDTATSVLDIKDENSNGEAQEKLKILRKIRHLHGGPPMTYLILKHEKTRDEIGHRRDVRGAKVWIGNVDQVIYHVIAPGAKRRRDGTRKTCLEPSKLRAFALRHKIMIDPSFTEGTPKGLILNANPVYSRSEHEAE